MITISHPEVCTGCLICELACSFHHTRAYSRSHSSVKIDKSIFNPERGARIGIFHANRDTHPACDLCEGEDLPLCVHFCPEEVFTVEGGPL